MPRTRQVRKKTLIIPAGLIQTAFQTSMKIIILGVFYIKKKDFLIFLSTFFNFFSQIQVYTCV